MSGNRAENATNRAENKVVFMSAIVEASSLLKQIAEPWQVGDTIKAAVNRAARKVGLPATRVEGLWRQEARLVRAEEMDAIRAAADRKIWEEGRAEFRAFEDRLARLEQALLVQDSDFHRDQADALRQAMGSQDRTMDRGERS